MKIDWSKIPYQEYARKLSVSVIYALVASVALNIFWRPGNIYASGMTGFAQIIETFLERYMGITIPFSVLYYALNIPIFVLSWRKLSRQLTIFTMITVTITAFTLELIPIVPLTTDPLLCALFGGTVNGFAVGFALKNNISSGGLDIISLVIRKVTGRTVGSVAIIFNGLVALTAGFLFGWQYAFYSVLSFFVSGKVMDEVFTKQKKMQVMIITKEADKVVTEVQKNLRRGITIVRGAEGAFDRSEQTVLFTVITRFELHIFEEVMKETDPNAFISIAENVKILGNFYDPGM